MVVSVSHAEDETWARKQVCQWHGPSTHGAGWIRNDGWTFRSAPRDPAPGAGANHTYYFHVPWAARHTILEALRPHPREPGAWQVDEFGC